MLSRQHIWAAALGRRALYYEKKVSGICLMLCWEWYVQECVLTCVQHVASRGQHATCVLCAFAKLMHAPAGHDFDRKAAIMAALGTATLPNLLLRKCRQGRMHVPFVRGNLPGQKRMLFTAVDW
jgi:hypothetical protein